MLILRDEAAAEDVASETLVRAWARHDTFVSDDHRGAWCWRVARNLCFDQLRGRRRVIALDDVGERPDDGEDAIAPLEREEEHRYVRLAFGKLNERHREALYLREVEGVAYEELARRMGTSQEGARQVVVRARQGLRRMLETVANGSLGVVAWVRTRARGMADRAASLAHPSLGRLVEAVAVLAVVGAVTFTPEGTAPEDRPARERGRAPRASAAVPVPRDAARAPAVLPPDAGDGPALVAARTGRPGEADVRATVPLGPAGDEEVFVRTWREDGDSPSVVLDLLDAVVAEACGLLGDGCEGLVGEEG